MQPAGCWKRIRLPMWVGRCRIHDPCRRTSAESCRRLSPPVEAAVACMRRERTAAEKPARAPAAVLQPLRDVARRPEGQSYRLGRCRRRLNRRGHIRTLSAFDPRPCVSSQAAGPGPSSGVTEPDGGRCCLRQLPCASQIAARHRTRGRRASATATYRAVAFCHPSRGAAMRPRRLARHRRG
jgi:hypothetical protein